MCYVNKYPFCPVLTCLTVIHVLKFMKIIFFEMNVLVADLKLCLNQTVMVLLVATVTSTPVSSSKKRSKGNHHYICICLICL